MLVILPCFANCEPFGFPTRRVPVSMLPVLSKSLSEHLLEQCTDRGLTRIRIALVEHPGPVREFDGNGERWGLDIHAWDFREPCSDEVLLSRLAEDHSGPVKLIPAETLIDLDVRSVLAGHKQGPQSVTRVHALQAWRGEKKPEGIFEADAPSCAGPMLDTGIRVVNTPADPNGKETILECSGTWLRADDPTKLWQANIAALNGGLSGVLPFGTTQRGKGQCTGHQCKMDPRSTIGSPVFLGNHVYISSDAAIRSGSLLGNGVIFDSHALVESSVVMDQAYTGTDIDVVDKIASGNHVFNAKTGSVLKVEDPVIVAGLRDKFLGHVSGRFTDKFSHCCSSWEPVSSGYSWGCSGW